MTDTDNSVLPNLSSLVLDIYTLTQRSSLSVLFQNPWKKLTEIRFEAYLSYYIPPTCHHTLSEFISIINESKLPNLTVLYLNGLAGDLDSLDERKIPHLNSLTLRSIRTSSSILVKSLIKKLQTWKIKKLDISYNNDLRGNLHILVSNILPSLRSLIVTNCDLNKYDLRSLSEALETGRLPQLRCLDISQNKPNFPSLCNVGIAGNLSSLLSAKFSSLQGLIVMNCRLNEDDLRSLARANASGKLPELRHLDLSFNGLIKKSLELLTKDPETDRPLSWRSVICDYKYLSNDDDSSDD